MKKTRTEKLRYGNFRIARIILRLSNLLLVKARTAPQTAAEFGVCRATIYRWLRQLDNLVDGDLGRKIVNGEARYYQVPEVHQRLGHALAGLLCADVHAMLTEAGIKGPFHAS